MKITSNESKSSSKGVMLLTSGVHAREYAPPELLMRFAQNTLKNYDKDADTTWILQQTEIHIIFYVNPDGRRKAEEDKPAMWRKNVNPGNNNKCSGDAYGVDINRNFDFVWGDKSGASDNPCDDSYMGPSAGSEPETQAVTQYAKRLFPESQRKNNPEAQMDEPFGEDITGLYMDVHAFGEFVYYRKFLSWSHALECNQLSPPHKISFTSSPSILAWGHKNKKSPDNESLEALGRKISSHNGYKLWAGGQPDFQYSVSGDSSDWMYAVLGVASFGLEIGQDFYESCDLFEKSILPSNLPALMYAAKVSKKPNSLAKGPDITKLDANIVNGKVVVTASASDNKLVNIKGYPSFNTGNQDVSGIVLSFGVHPDDRKGRNGVVDMSSSGNGFEASISMEEISSGRHILYAQAKDEDGYLGPVSSIFVEVSSSSSVSSSAATQDQSSSQEGETGSWTTIANEDFDTGYGTFRRGANVHRYSSAKKRDGVVRVQDGALSTKFDTSYSKYEVSFSALFQMGTNDNFCLGYRTAGAWKQAQCWSANDVNTGTWYDDMSTSFDAAGSNIVIRFRCTGQDDSVFVDKVLIRGKP
jgi:hypothetical protein